MPSMPSARPGPPFFLRWYQAGRNAAAVPARAIRRLLARWSAAEWALGTVLGTLALSSVSFFTVSYVISSRDPGYFDRKLLAVAVPTLDPIVTGTIAGEAHDSDVGEPIPVPTVVRTRTPTPDDYQIVMIFQDEALLATGAELTRVKVGSNAPGLGRILEIQAGEVRTENATLRQVAK